MSLVRVIETLEMSGAIADSAHAMQHLGTLSVLGPFAVAHRIKTIHKSEIPPALVGPNVVSVAGRVLFIVTTRFFQHDTFNFGIRPKPILNP